MKVLFIECGMGAAGDMLMAALMELCPEPDVFLKKMNMLGIEDAVVRGVDVEKNGVCGKRIDVILNGLIEESDGFTEYEHSHIHNSTHDHKHIHDHSHDCSSDRVHAHGSHVHRTTGDVMSLIRSLDISDAVKEMACSVYSVLAEAEALAHGKPVELVHFHEVGALDAVCDIVGCCLALELISPDVIVVSPVNVGFGTVKCQHGVLPVPAPATAYILCGVPIYSSEVEGELCTPTGAALLKSFAHSFGRMPMMSVQKIGYGMGKMDFVQLNCVRAFLGDCLNIDDTVYEISCNLDDITSEEMAFSYDKLFDAGALDVYAVPAVMKKNRAAHVLTALATVDSKDAVAKALLEHTTTRGVRLTLCERLTLQFHYENITTEYGDISVKVSSGFGITKIKPEYDCVVKAAKEHNVRFSDVYKSTIEKYTSNSKSWAPPNPASFLKKA